MVHPRVSWTVGLALWLGLFTTQAGAQFAIPYSQTQFQPQVQDQGLRPFVLRGNGAVILNRPAFYGAQQQYTQDLQQLGALQPGFGYPLPAGQGSGLPFSTLPPPQYFFNYNPYFPLLRPNAVPPPVGSPAIQ